MIDPGIQNGFNTWYGGILDVVARMISEAQLPSAGSGSGGGTGSAQVGTLWFTLNGGTTALATTDFLEAPVDFSFVITGWKLMSRTSGSIVLSVAKCAFSDYPSFQFITGNAPPNLSLSRTGSSDDVSAWSSTISAGDVLELRVATNVGLLRRVSVGLRYRRIS